VILTPETQLRWTHIHATKIISSINPFHRTQVSGVGHTADSNEF